MTRMRSGLAAVLTGLLGVPLVVTGVVLAHHNDPPCPGDVDGDGVVGTYDLLAVLGDWGECPGHHGYGCDADLDNDGNVGTSDLLEVIANWGVCDGGGYGGGGHG